jgi:predicted O-methyltransferase YrrM
MAAQTISPAVQAEIQRVGRLVARRDDAWAIPRVSAEFLHLLVLAGGFRRGIELGTSYGYSGLWIGAAFACNGGTLLTIDREPAKAASARETFARAGLADVITTVLAPVDEALAEADGPFDFAFIDGFHTQEQCAKDAEAVARVLAPRSYLAFHDYGINPNREVPFGVTEAVDAFVADGKAEMIGVVRTLAVVRLA